MKKQVIALLAVFLVLLSFPSLNAAKVQISSEVSLVQGNPWSAWKEFLFSGTGTGVFWRCGFADPSSEVLSVQLKNENDFTVSFSSFTVGGSGWGQKNIWRGTLDPKKTFAMDEKSDSPDRGGQGDRILVQARLEGLGKGSESSRRMEAEQPQSPESKKAHNHTMGMYQKYIQAVGAGTSSNVNQGLVEKYREARQTEDSIKASEFSATSTPDLALTEWPR